jgi:sugar lactone lactonase YvrE
MVMNQIDDIAYRSGQGKSKLQVVYDSDVSWPFEWYLRDYTSRVFIGNGMPPANAPVVLAGVDNGRDQQVKQALGNNYVAQRYRLRWWFPEDTTYRNWTIPMIVQDLLNSTDRSALWRYLMYRETPSELGSTDFMLFVRRDLAYGPWAAPQATSQTADDTLYTQRQRVVPANQIIGTAGAANGQLSAPKGIAVAPSGEMYVADSGNNRIEEFGPNGQYVRAWGTKGTGNGQFNEPWDVAVGPQGDVYVADTWNHRIQEFTPTGGFVRSWGSNPVGQPQNGDGQFFGPRAIAFDAQGNVYVTDTGNKRIEKFDPQGRFLAAFGGPGADPGLFNEPVGLAIDQAGDVYVADTWNQRIQKLGPDFKPITSWPVAGWTDQSVLDKPYLALDPSGNVWVTDPSNNRVLEFGPNGQLLVSLGKVGNDQASFTFPTGVAVDAKGNLYVTDSQNNRIMVFGAIH